MTTSSKAIKGVQVMSVLPSPPGGLEVSGSVRLRDLESSEDVKFEVARQRLLDVEAEASKNAQHDRQKIEDLEAKINALRQVVEAITDGKEAVRILTLNIPHDNPPGFALARRGYSGDPLHLMTNVKLKKAGYAKMYRLRFHGYHFGASTAFDAVAVGYQNSEYGLTNNSVGYNFDGKITIDTYESKSGFLTFKLSSSVNWHASVLQIDLLPVCSWYAALAEFKDGFQLICHSQTNL